MASMIFVISISDLYHQGGEKKSLHFKYFCKEEIIPFIINEAVLFRDSTVHWCISAE